MQPPFRTARWPAIAIGPSRQRAASSHTGAEPPLTRPLGLDEMVTGLSAFDFQCEIPR